MKMFHWKTSLSRVIIIRRYKFEMSPTQFEWNKRGHPKFDNNVAIFVYIIKCVRVLEFQGGWPEGWRISSSQTNSMEIAGRKIYIRCMDHLKLTKYSNTKQFIFDVCRFILKEIKIREVHCILFIVSTYIVSRKNESELLNISWSQEIINTCKYIFVPKTVCLLYISYIQQFFLIISDNLFALYIRY